MKVMKIIINNLSFYKDKKLEIDFTAKDRVFREQITDNLVNEITDKIRLNNTIALLGINASGKTSTIKIIAEILNIYIQNNSLSYESDLIHYFNDELSVEIVLCDNENIYKVNSLIKKQTKDKKIYFTDEQLYVKKLTSVKNKNDIFEFSNIIANRKDIEDKYLKMEDSIFSGVLNGLDKEISVRDITMNTNFNFLSMFSNEFPIETINFFDKNIEYIIAEEDEEGDLEKISWRLKFKNSEEIIVSNIIQLQNYLSSGTIKGLTVLINISIAMKTGGYVIIDEIENHLNKVIVTHLINLFNSEINKNGATLIFSTHYTEIIDGFVRSDNIYILQNKEKISVNNLSDLLTENRKDKKKSNLIFSGIFGTAPTYKSLIEMKIALKEWCFPDGN